MVVRPAVIFGLETVKLRKTQEMEQLRLRDYETRVREIWLRWFGHIQRGDSGYSGQKMLKMEPGMRKNGKPQRRFMYVMTEDM